jgi:type I restriction enzyme M protein
MIKPMPKREKRWLIENIRVFDTKENIEYFARSVPNEEVVAKDYNLSVSTYIEAKDNREIVDIHSLMLRLKS